MLVLGPIAFTAPWLLLGLAALPILWILLRAVPPAPVRRRFAAVALLLGLRDAETEADRTPWWLLLLRLLAVAALVIGFSGPVLNPEPRQAGTGPLLIIADATWADARTWETRKHRIAALLAEAGRSARPVAVMTLTDVPPQPPRFETADVAAIGLGALQPQPWAPQFAAALGTVEAITGSFDTVWYSDGLEHSGRAALAQALAARGALTVYQVPQAAFGLRPASYADGLLAVSAIRTPIGSAQSVSLAAIGPDPSGVETQLATASVDFAEGAAMAEVSLSLPPELRNRITRLELTGQRSAAAITLADDSLRRREVAMIAGGGDREGLELLSPLHYLREALAPSADILSGALGDLILANPDVLILADVATLNGAESDAMIKWVEEGGLLVRFAGPRLAALDPATIQQDPLMPVRIRAGGRSIGGAMSWGDPKALAVFDETSPFAGLAIPDDVTVSTQVMAQPDPTLADRVIARLADGTPLVTRQTIGDGQVVLFHVTANAEWSTLPLSGLFVQMLERLAILGARPVDALTDLAGTTWVPQQTMDAFGRLTPVDTLPAVTGEAIADGALGPDLPPGLYAREDRVIALNVIGADTLLEPARWPAGITVEGISDLRETQLGGWALALAAIGLLADLLATMALSGRLVGARAAPALVALLIFLPQPQMARAQTGDDAFAIEATSNVVLAYVLTGDRSVDDTSAAGLYGLSNVLFQRTSIEPTMPMGVDIENDELAFFPLLYWPVTAEQPLPSRDAYAKLNRYLRTGGMILFDTRDADTAGFGTATQEGRRLQSIALGLDIPALEPIPSDHVLTRAFYLLQDFPGRHAGRDLWVEASPPGADQAEGMPFRNLTDGVTPVIIGGNDWAAAWATSEMGAPLFQVGRGAAGDRQREIAFRFGVNVVMHVLTGNYKSDQVHVPALLDRLGQ